MKSRFSILGFLFLLLVPVAVQAGDSVATVIGKRQPTAILRMMPSGTSIAQQLAGLTFLAGYQVIGDPVPIPPEQAAKLAAAIQAPDAFDGNGNQELLRPGVAYRFGSGADAVDLLVCFSCDKVATVPAGSQSVTTTNHITQATRDVLLNLAKELLPQDEAIQDLPKVRNTRPVPPPAVPVPSRPNSP